MDMAGKKKITFEEALARLDEIVHAMEAGGAMLDESLSLFEEGIRLVKYCQIALDGAEQKVKLLQKTEEQETAENAE